MPRNNYRRRQPEAPRRAQSGHASYEIQRRSSDIFPRRHPIAMWAAVLLIIFVLFVTTCISAVVYTSSQSKLEDAQKEAENCSAYYAAETAAIEILTASATGDDSKLINDNGELKYDLSGTDIIVSQNENQVYFRIPAGNKETLHVIARITGEYVDVVRWNLED